jgi:hypothetical protein
VTREESGPVLRKVEEVVPQGRSLSSEPVASMPRRARKSKRNDVWTPVLGVLVIGAAVLLGTLVGWRMGWQRATLGARVFLPPHRANVHSTTGQINHTVSPAPVLPPSSVAADECGPGAASSSAAQPPNGGLTVCQDGRVIFRMPPSPPSPRSVKTSQRSPGLKRNPTQR